MKDIALISAVALLLNAVCVVLHTDYIASVCLVMLGVIGIAAAMHKWSVVDAKAVAFFVIGSAVITTGIEKLMLVYDVWNFSRHVFVLTGVTFLSAPIEEYIYWWLCPGIVSVCYLLFRKTASNTQVTMRHESYSLVLASTLAKYWTYRNQSKYHDPGMADRESYLEDKGIDSKDARYSRGRKIPVWAYVAAAVTFTALILKRSFHGSWKAVIGTCVVFVCVAYPNELYSLHNGLWVYNQQRIFGIWLLGVPVEEWFMYTMSPVAGSMLVAKLVAVFDGSVK